jgi:ankyrin repeat protein
VLAAATRSKIELLKLFVLHGANVKAVDTNGFSAVHYSSIAGDVELTSWLLNYGADANVANLRGSTPLHCAASYDHAAVCEVLLESGADVNAKDEVRTIHIDLLGLLHGYSSCIVSIRYDTIRYDSHTNRNFSNFSFNTYLIISAR